MSSNELELPKGQHRSSWIVTKAPIRLKFEEIKLKPQNGGSHGFLEFTDIDLAVSIFGAWCASMDQGCIQIFDAIHEREIGYLEI